MQQLPIYSTRVESLDTRYSTFKIKMTSQNIIFTLHNYAFFLCDMMFSFSSLCLAAPIDARERIQPPPLMAFRPFSMAYAKQEK